MIDYYLIADMITAFCPASDLDCVFALLEVLK